MGDFSRTGSAFLELLRNPRREELVGLVRHARRFRAATRADHPVAASFAGEEVHARELLGRLGLDGGYVVDIAASDGVLQSSTLWMFAQPAWTGLAVEMDPRKFAKLAFAYAAFPGVRLANARVTPDNVDLLLRLFEAPRDLAFLNLDIDSYDLFVLLAMLGAGYRPRVISMEVNEKIPPPLWFTVRYDPEHFWHGDHFMGCSLQAAATALAPHGYLLESLVYNNAFFVEAGFAAGRVTPLAPAEAYRAGYGGRDDRLALFPWNADVDCLQGMSPPEAAAFLDRLFAPYAGKYELRIDGPAPPGA